MEARAVTANGGRTARVGQSRGATLAIMAVTAVIIAAVAFMVNQPAAGAGGVTSVTLTGDASGEAPTVGKPAPDFTATTIDGKTVKLSDFKGQPLWLTFGASWCQPCRAENPDVLATYEKLKGRGLVVLAIFISEDAPAVKDYADRVGLTYQKVADPDTRIASEYRILGIPSHYFIDRSGVLVQLKIGSLDPAAMEAAVEAILR
jgi:peroxiredoxin